MIEIRCKATGSKGNMYVISDSNHNLLILELGLGERDCKSIPNYQVDAILVSHHHSDHDYPFKNERMSDEMKKCNYKVYTCDDLEPLHYYKFNDYEVIPFENEHNVKCYSYLIKVENQTILFTTDSKIIPKINHKIDYFMVECNYDVETWKDAIEHFKVVQPSRLLHLSNVCDNHCSLEYNQAYFSELGYRPKGIFHIHKSNSGLLDTEKAKGIMKQFTDNYIIVNSGDRITI